MRVVFQCEIDPWCRGILAERWPGVPCFEDVREVSSRSVGERLGQVDGDGARADAERPRVPFGGADARAGVDGLAGGFPCQDVSVAGQRRGLAGARSGLFFEAARIADELVRPGGWLVIENVPGLLSSNGGRDFAVVLRTLGDIGFHDLAWRVLDSRYFGVPQRRRRVFIVGRRAVGTGAREVLLEPESSGGDFAPGREARPGTTRGAEVSTLQARRGRTGDTSAEAAAGGQLVPLRSPAHADGVRAASGFPRRVDDPQPDGPRYAAMGNAVTVPVAEWIGRRIVTYEEARHAA